MQSLLGQALSASVRLQAGRMGGRLDSLEADNGSLYGISTALSDRTPSGPLMLSLGSILDQIR
jgi:hypothetical protein